MPTTYYKTASPGKQHSQQRDQRPATWLGSGGSTHHHHRNNNNNHHHPYGFIPIHVPWYALSGLGYQQQHPYPGGAADGPAPTGIFFTSEQPSSSSNSISSSNMSATWEPVGSEQPQGASSSGGQGGDGATGVNSRGGDDDNNNSTPDPQHATVSLVPSNTGRAVPPEPQTDHALRFLSRHLEEAIAVCEGYTQEHENNTEGVKLYLDAASRDRLWAGLLESKFKEDEGHMHLLRSLPYDVDAAVRQALRAAHQEKKKLAVAAAAAADQEENKDEDRQDKLDRCDKRAHEIEILRMRGARVAKLAGTALVAPGKCKKLVEEMAMMRQTIETICAKME